MIYRYFVQSNQFVLMQPPCKAWQILIDVVRGIKRNDFIEVIELDSQYIETGKRLIGQVRWVTSGDMVVNNNSSTFAYTIQINILPVMRTIIYTFNLDGDGTLAQVKPVYNTTGVSWSFVQSPDGVFTLAPDNDFSFQFKTYAVSTPNDINKAVVFDPSDTSTTTTFETYAIGSDVTPVNMYSGWVKVDFYV